VISLLAMSLIIAGTLLALVLSVFSLKIALDSLTSIKAMEKSTHSIQYVPIDDAWTKEEKRMNEVTTKRGQQGNADDDIDDLADLAEREGNIT